MADPVIKVDVSHAKAVLLSTMPASADRARILRGIGAAATATWKKIALAQLRSTSRDYVAGISAPVLGQDGSVAIELVGRMPNMVEQGWAGGDMRQWLLTGKSAKQGKNGPYAVVPFRHGTPGTGGRNVGTPMPGPIHEVAKRLAATVSRPGAAITGRATPGSTTVWGQRLHPGLPMKQQAREILGRKEKPWHATSIYMGMVRKAQPTAKGMQTSGFTTFRTISRYSSDPQHWIHPGIRARAIAPQVQREMEKLAHQIVVAAMNGKGGER